MTHGTMALGLGVGVIHTIPGIQAITGDHTTTAVGDGMAAHIMAMVADGIITVT